VVRRSDIAIFREAHRIKSICKLLGSFLSRTSLDPGCIHAHEGDKVRLPEFRPSRRCDGGCRRGLQYRVRRGFWWDMAIRSYETKTRKGRAHTGLGFLFRVGQQMGREFERVRCNLALPVFVHIE